jgi:hypothetical protein
MISPPLQTIDPRTICLAIPCHTGRVDVLCANGVCNVIGTGRLANQPLWQYGGSDVRAVRNSIAHQFLNRTTAEWLVMIDDDIGFSVRDWDYLFEDEAGERAVVAEYLQKTAERRIAHFGLGFCRVHRSVFEALEQLTGEDGTPWVKQGMYCGQLLWDYYCNGVNAAGEYRGEDHGFWTLVRLADVQLRVERRTNLVHSGRGEWRYDAQELATVADDSGAN